ncbi:alpha-L-rhamnosidase C-terminal domain-containing protein [Arenivirga flava]
MTSFNHYALGAVADWMHRDIAGLAPTAPGYRTVRVRPTPGGGLTSASAEHESPYGRIAVAWRIVETRFELEVTLPTGVSGHVELPDGTSLAVASGTLIATCELLAPPGAVGAGPLHR